MEYLIYRGSIVGRDPTFADDYYLRITENDNLVRSFQRYKSIWELAEITKKENLTPSSGATITTISTPKVTGVEIAKPVSLDDLLEFKRVVGE